LLLASRNGKVIFPSWFGARRRICPCKSEAPGCLERIYRSRPIAVPALRA
jgi:hypothetical protein